MHNWNSRRLPKRCLTVLSVLLWCMLLTGCSRQFVYTSLIYDLKKDKTELNVYSDEYACKEFSLDLSNKLNSIGWTSRPVILLLSDGSVHEIVKVVTYDIGAVFIEPQTDEIYFHPIVGESLCTPRHCFEQKIDIIL